MHLLIITYLENSVQFDYEDKKLISANTKAFVLINKFLSLDQLDEYLRTELPQTKVKHNNKVSCTICQYKSDHYMRQICRKCNCIKDSCEYRLLFHFNSNS